MVSCKRSPALHRVFSLGHRTNHDLLSHLGDVAVISFLHNVAVDLPQSLGARLRLGGILGNIVDDRPCDVIHTPSC